MRGFYELNAASLRNISLTFSAQKSWIIKGMRKKCTFLFQINQSCLKFMNTSLPKVSVVIPTYNRARYICRAINSVINQTFKDLEIIVIDDGSTDNTKEVLAQYGNRIVYLAQSNKGISASRNRGISAARGNMSLSLIPMINGFRKNWLSRSICLIKTKTRSCLQ